jgi:uncharacterized membrane protein
MTATTPHHPQPEPAPAPVATHAPDGTGQSIAALVLGILAVTSMGLLTGIPAIVFGIIGIKKHPREKGMALAGLIMGGVGTLLSVIALVFFIVIIMFSAAYDRTPSQHYPTLYNTPSSRT